MDAAGPIPPTLPFHLHKAYGTPTPQPTQRTITVRPVSTTAPAQPATIAQPAARPTSPTPPTDTTTLASAVEAKARSARIASLVAAKVDTPAVDTGFPRPTAAVAQPRASERASDRAGALPFYRHPSDANRVATEIAIGRSLDAKG
jgi:hypothetical protein